MTARKNRPYLGRHGFRPCRLPGHVPVLSGDLAVPGPHSVRTPGGYRHDGGTCSVSNDGATPRGWFRDQTTLARILAGLRAL
ncbi:hypothetical protein, partial [Actinopolyspora lacussalsi]|uniref:hypothetical protein n=1 Tax=Actinopolyspora righensis TaxID=995060 RepID=UPI001C3170B5